MKQILLFITALCISATISNAQWTNDTYQNTIVHDTLDATYPLIAALPNGNTYVAWFESEFSNYDLHMQLLDSNGYKLWPPDGIVISNYPQNSALYTSDLKTDNEGNAIVAFQDMRTGILNVVAYKVSAAGNLVWGSTGITLIDSSAQGGIGPAIGVAQNDDVVIAWNTSDSTNNRWIVAQRISSAGNILWSNLYKIKDTVTSLKYTRPELFACDSNGIQILYVEESGNFPGVTSTMYTQKIDASGNNVWTSPVMVSSKTIPYFHFPVPEPDSSGGFYIGFNTSNPVNPTLNDVYVQHVDKDGNLWNATGNQADNSSTTSKTLSASCFAPSQNTFWALLKVEGGSNFGVTAQYFNSTGTAMFGPTAHDIVLADPVEKNPATIDDAGDGAIITFTQGSFGNELFYATKIDNAGFFTWAGAPIALCTRPSNKDDIQSGNLINNNLVFVWQDDRNGSGIFAQNIYADGTIGLPTGINILNDENNMTLSPNPSASPQIIFSKLSKSDRVIKINDVRGKEIGTLKVDANVSSVSLQEYSNLPQGVYFVTVNNSDNREIIKWIKN